MIDFNSGKRKNDYLNRRIRKLQSLVDQQVQEQKIQDSELKTYELMKSICLLAMDKVDRLEREISVFKYKEDQLKNKIIR